MNLMTSRRADERMAPRGNSNELWPVGRGGFSGAGVHTWFTRLFLLTRRRSISISYVPANTIIESK